MLEAIAVKVDFMKIYWVSLGTPQTFSMKVSITANRLNAKMAVAPQIADVIDHPGGPDDAGSLDVS